MSTFDALNKVRQGVMMGETSFWNMGLSDDGSPQ